MKSQEKIESNNLVFKWDKNADEKLKDLPYKMNFEDYLKFLEQFKPTEDELRQVRNFNTKFTL